MNSCCRTRIRTSTNWTKTSCAAITPYDSPPKRVCKYTFFYFCTNTQVKKYARLIKKLEFEGSKLLNYLHHTNAKFKKIRKSVRFKTLKHSSSTKAFTEKGLYMLATILKSPIATQTSIAIIESYARVKELNRNIQAIHNEPDNKKQKGIIQKTGELLSDLICDEADAVESESSVELNLMAIKFKHTVKKTKNDKKSLPQTE